MVKTKKERAEPETPKNASGKTSRKGSMESVGKKLSKMEGQASLDLSSLVKLKQQNQKVLDKKCKAMDVEVKQNVEVK